MTDKSDSVNLEKNNTQTENLPEDNTVSKQQNNTFTLTRQKNGVAHLIMDVKGDSMNTLKTEFSEEVSAILQTIKRDQTIVGVVLLSGKSDSFVAGADVNMLAACTSVEEATSLSRQGQVVFDQLSQLTIPIVAAIHGPCLGGGLELALACHARVCSDSPKTVLGVPEVQLGLLPGGGGTQRLPKLVGIQTALDMMLTGKQIRAKKALKVGLVHDVVDESILISTAEELVLSGKIAAKKPRLSFMAKLLENNAIGRKVLFSQAEKMIISKTKGNYPAPLYIIDCVRTGVEQAPAKGYQVEAEHFGQLVMSDVSKQLRNLFFSSTQMKKEQGVTGVEAKPINNVAVLGGGLMGGGIAFVTATKAKLPVRIKDIAHQGISHALAYGYNLLNKKVKRGIIRHSQMQQQLANITGTTDYSGFNNTDLVIEAVFEDLPLKQQMVADIETHCHQETIFASNTSSLPIGQIAANAARPEKVIGLHYFSPVDKMPLAEIIAHEKTSDETISTVVAFAKKQGKTPIVVKDKAGFYVNRILAPYMNEAANILLEGYAIEALDKALVQFGFPVGPMQLLDEVGIDIGAKISPILQAELGERFATPDAFSTLIDDGRLGKKSKKGFYRYDNKKLAKKKQVDTSVYQLLGITLNNNKITEEQVQRCVYVMLNEAVRCLDEGIIRNARDGDIGAIFGIGFPPFLGGPFSYIDSIGADTITEKLTHWTSVYGERYAPCQGLIDMVENNKRFY